MLIGFAMLMILAAIWGGAERRKRRMRLAALEAERQRQLRVKIVGLNARLRDVEAEEQRAEDELRAAISRAR